MRTKRALAADAPMSATVTALFLLSNAGKSYTLFTRRGDQLFLGDQSLARSRLV